MNPLCVHFQLKQSLTCPCWHRTPFAMGAAMGKVKWDPCHIINEKHKLLPGDMPAILERACYRCQKDPDLQKGGSYKVFEDIVYWGECNRNEARLGYRVFRHADGTCGLSSAYLEGREVELTETRQYRMLHCARSADQSKARVDDCFEVKSSQELLNYLKYTQCKSSLASRSC
eukprot:Skav212549  [mRNA]  locus=scaffold1851:643172:643690:+ [translate_table: standard]